jgi:hypothetical protein
MSKDPHSLHLSETVYGFSEYVERRFQLRFVEDETDLAERTVTVVSTLNDIESYLDGTDFVTYRSGRTVTGELSDPYVLVIAEEIDRSVEIRVLGGKNEVERTVTDLSSVFIPVPVRIRWVYNGKGDDVKLPIRVDDLPQTSFYPQLNGESLTDYYDRFIASRSNVLVLIGPPGTGKTSFIRGLLHHSRSGGIVSYDPGVLESDDIFAEFMSGKEKFMILEDADTFLASRGKSGNTIMHRFLNVGDGLISTSGKKIVFSTNLPSVRDIDDALLRPGRCFDVMRFGKFTSDQARTIRPDYVGTDSITLAELMNGDVGGKGDTGRVGFV